MTTIQTTNPWTPELIQKDKDLKAKNGNAAHIIPAQQPPVFNVKLAEQPQVDVFVPCSNCKEPNA